jgi:hypothetical protein
VSDGQPRHRAAVCLLALVVLALLPGPLLRGGVLFRRDLSMVWLPQAETFVRVVSAGAWPLWDPWRAFGMPLLGDPRAEIAYPITWLNLLVSPATYMTVFAALHLLLAGAGTYLLARRGMGRLASLAAAALWTSCGPLVSLVSTWHHLAGAAWMPWILWAADRARSPAPGAGRAVVLALVFGAQVVAGSPDYSAATLLLLAVLLAAPSQEGPKAAGLSHVAVGLGLGAGLSAVQWLTTLDLLAGTARAAAGREGAAAWSLSWAQLVEIAVPVWWNGLALEPGWRAVVLGDREPFLLSIYVGGPALAFALVGTRQVHRWRLPLLVILLVALAAALGSNFAVYGALVTALPPLGLFRFPVKALVPASLALCVLAGLGVERTLDSVRRPQGRTGSLLLPLCAAFLLAAAVAVALLAGGPALLRPLLADPVAAGPALEAQAALAGRGAAASALVLGAVALALRRRDPRFLALALACAVAELCVRHARVNDSASVAPWSVKPPALQAMSEADHARVYVHDYSISPGWTDAGHHAGAYDPGPGSAGWSAPAATAAVFAYLNPPTAARYGVAGSYDFDTLGLYPSELDRMVHLVHRVEGSPLHRRLLRLGAVDFASALLPAPWWSDLEPVAVYPGWFQHPIQLLRVPDPMPRVYVAAGVRVAAGEEAERVLADPAFDPRGEVVLVEGPPSPPGTGRARVLARRADAWSVETESDTPAHLVLVEAWDRGWRATVDGVEAPVRRANLLFRAVPVPAGRHVVELRYRPRGAIAGAALSAMTLLGLAAWAVRDRVRSAA